jgi:hypothetical protein
MDKPEFDQYAEQYDRVLGAAIPEGLSKLKPWLKHTPLGAQNHVQMAE